VFVNAIVQGAVGFGMFRTIGGLVTTPGIGMTSEGVAWFADLTLADPTYVLPAVMAGGMWVMIWVSHWLT